MLNSIKPYRFIRSNPWGLLFLVLIFLSACSTAPRIVVEPPSKDLGEVPQKPLEISYTIRNEGGSDLIIEKISTSCGCTSATVDKNIISPGDTASLQVTLDPIADNLFGNLTRVIYVRSNDPKTPEAEVEFRVIILNPDGEAP